MNFQYKVIPFIGQARGTLSPEDVARQLESMINSNASNGWEFYQLSDVNVEVQPGCLGSLFGAKVRYARFDQLIFRSSAAPYGNSKGDQSGVRLEQAGRSSGRAQGSAEAVPELKADARPSLSITSKHVQVWRQKTDDEILSAAAKLQDYTEEGQAVILAEVARRSLNQGKMPDTIGQQGKELAKSVTPDDYCYHCGSDVAHGSTRCESCGKDL